MYTPKRNHNKLEESLIGHGGSPFRSLNSSFTQDQSMNDVSRKTPSRRTFQVIEQASSHQLVTYGNAIPVEVAEVLSAANESYVSAKIFPNGWACVVCNRKLLVWRYTASSIKKTVNCMELQMSSSDLTHKADLTCIINNEQRDPMQAMNAKTSVINVSAEGTARFWQNINRPAVFLEANLNLNGQQCHSLLPLMPYGCILTTTTNGLYFIWAGISSVYCRALSTSSGMLSSISRRVSSFWSQPSVPDGQVIPCICSSTVDFDAPERTFVVVVNEHLQKWQVMGSSESDAKMLFQVDLKRCIRACNSVQNFPFDSVEKVHVISMKSAGYGTIMLLALHIGDDCYHALATLQLHGTESQVSISQVVMLDNILQDQEGSELTLTLPIGDYHVFISSSSMILSQSVSNKQWDPIRIDFNNNTNPLLGVGSHGSDPVFLSRRHGLVTVKLTYNPDVMLMEQARVNAKAKVADESMTVDADEGNLPVDAYAILKNAFVMFSKGISSEKLTLPLDYSSKDIEEAIVRLSYELLDSSPATDPTWAAQHNCGLVTTSVLLMNQLKDKENIHEVFRSFVEQDFVRAVAQERFDDIQFEVDENGEKLQSIFALLDMHSKSGPVIDSVINMLDIDIPVTKDAGTNKKTEFYTHVTDVGSFFSALIKMEESKLAELTTLKEQIDLISTASELFSNCYTAAWRYRQSISKMKQSQDQPRVPWTGSALGVNNRSLLKQQVQRQIEHALPNVDSTKIGSLLTEQLILMADLLLDGYERELAVLESQQDGGLLYEGISEEFQQQRQFIIMALVNLGYYEEARALAEKFEDFISLILMCEKTKDTQRLEDYKTKFHEQGFAKVLYRWYMEKGAWGTLMLQKSDTYDFGSFLGEHNHLSWLHYIDTKEFSKSSNVLKHLSNTEKDIAARKKIMLVLSNLAMLASEESPRTLQTHTEAINDELELIEYQDRLMEFLGKDPSTSPPIAADELIQICMAEDVDNLGEEQFMILLQLLHHVHSKEEIALQLWNKCIRYDSWDESQQVDYSAILSQKLFFKCLKYCHKNDAHQPLIPSLQELLSHDSISSNSVLTRQIKACYELIGI